MVALPTPLLHYSALDTDGITISGTNADVVVGVLNRGSLGATWNMAGSDSASGVKLLDTYAINGNKTFTKSGTAQLAQLSPETTGLSELNWFLVAMRPSTFKAGEQYYVGQEGYQPAHPIINYLGVNSLNRDIFQYRTDTGSTDMTIYSGGAAANDDVPFLLHGRMRQSGDGTFQSYELETLTLYDDVLGGTPIGTTCQIHGIRWPNSQNADMVVGELVVSGVLTDQEILDTKQYLQEAWFASSSAPVDENNKITAVGGITNPMSLFNGMSGGEVVSWSSPSTGSVATVTIDANGYPEFSSASIYDEAVFQYNWETSAGAGDWNTPGTYTGNLQPYDLPQAPSYGTQTSFENTEVGVDLATGWDTAGTTGVFTADQLPGAMSMDTSGFVTGDSGASGQSVAVTVTYTPTSGTPLKPPTVAAPFDWDVIVRPPVGESSGAAKMGLKLSISIS